MEVPCVLFALGRESNPFLRSFRHTKRLRHAPFPVWLGSGRFTAIVAQTGIGAESAETAMDWLLHDGVTYRPTLIISAGFAGGLNENVRVGDVVIPTEVVDGRGVRLAVTASISNQTPTRHETVLTVDRLIGNAVEKRTLGAMHSAHAVDMESWSLARACAKAGIEFACVRVVSDDVHTDLSPVLVSLMSAGRVHLPTLVRRFAARPTIIFELFRLARATNRAANVLSATLNKLLEPSSSQPRAFLSK